MNYEELAKKLLGGTILLIIVFMVLMIFSQSTPQNIQNNTIRDYYRTEVMVSESPTDYLRLIEGGKTDLIAVDLRSAPEYNISHLVTSINIPAGSMNPEQLVAAFKALPQDKTIITYCYSSYCMLSKKVGKTLGENGIYVKHFTAGWLEIKRDYNDFVVYGKDPGILTVTPTGACSVNNTGEFGC